MATTRLKLLWNDGGLYEQQAIEVGDVSVWVDQLLRQCRLLLARSAGASRMLTIETVFPSHQHRQMTRISCHSHIDKLPLSAKLASSHHCCRALHCQISPTSTSWLTSRRESGSDHLPARPSPDTPRVRCRQLGASPAPICTHATWEPSGKPLASQSRHGRIAIRAARYTSRAAAAPIT